MSIYECILNFKGEGVFQNADFPLSIKVLVSLKRAFDIFLSGLGLLISFPVWVFIALGIIIESGGPVLFSQERVGKDGNIFDVLKFRSMDKKAHKESPTEHVDCREERITRVGRVIRAMALDELPQLISIFKGDMSFVGPRPMHPEEPILNDSKYDKLEDVPDFSLRCAVRPGLTGITQVYAPKELQIEKKMKYDLLYLKKFNLLLDLKLIIMSFLVTFMGRWEKADRGVPRVKEKELIPSHPGILKKPVYSATAIIGVVVLFVAFIFYQGGTTFPSNLLSSVYAIKVGSYSLGEILVNLAHFPIYGLLTFALIYGYLRLRRKTEWKKAIAFAGSLAFVISLIDEFHQSFTPGRTVSVMDLSINLAAIVTVVSVYSYRLKNMIGT